MVNRSSSKPPVVFAESHAVFTDWCRGIERPESDFQYVSEPKHLHGLDRDWVRSTALLGPGYWKNPAFSYARENGYLITNSI